MSSSVVPARPQVPSKAQNPGSDPPSRLLLFIAQQLRDARRAQKLSLDKLADISGVSRAMIGQIEGAKGPVTVNVLEKLSAALGVTLSYLIDDSTRPAFAVTKVNYGGSYGSVAKQIGVLAGLPHGLQSTIYELTLQRSDSFDWRRQNQPGKIVVLLAGGHLMFSIDGKSNNQLKTSEALIFSAFSDCRLTNTGVEPARAFIIQKANKAFDP